MSKSVRTGPSSYEKRICQAAVSQRLRNIDLQNLPPSRHHLLFHLFDTQHFLDPLMMESGELSFQAVLIHYPNSASDGHLMFPAVLVGNSR
jgi:hypothetical protein